MEHRVAAAGPSIIDNVANAAFYFGAVRALSSCETPPEQRMSFPQARTNFYLAAEYGFDAEIPGSARASRAAAAADLGEAVAAGPTPGCMTSASTPPRSSTGSASSSSAPARDAPPPPGNAPGSHASDRTWRP
jgi:hypothetical protein